MNKLAKKIGIVFILLIMIVSFVSADDFWIDSDYKNKHSFNITNLDNISYSNASVYFNPINFSNTDYIEDINGNEINYSFPNKLIYLNNINSGNTLYFNRYFNSMSSENHDIELENYSQIDNISIESGEIENYTLPTIEIDFENRIENTNSNSIDIGCSVNAKVGIDILKVYSIFNDGYYELKDFVELDTTSYKNNFTIDNVESGTYSFICKANLKNGEFVETNKTYFIVDNIKPNLEILTLSYDREDSTLPVQATITYNASDIHDIDCYYKIDDDEFVNTTCNEYITHKFESFGTHTFTIKVDDIFGNSKSVISEYINIEDNLPPTILIDKPRTSADLVNSSVDLIIKTNENSSCEYSLNSGSYFEMFGDLNHVSIVDLVEQEFTLRFRCEDIYGNIGETDTETYSLTFNPKILNATRTFNIGFLDENVYIRNGYNLIDFVITDDLGNFVTATDINVLLSGVGDYELTKMVSYDIGKYKIELFAENITDKVTMEIIVNGNTMVSKQLKTYKDNNIGNESNSIFQSIGNAIKQLFDSIARLFQFTEKVENKINITNKTE